MGVWAAVAAVPREGPSEPENCAAARRHGVPHAPSSSVSHLACTKVHRARRHGRDARTSGAGPHRLDPRLCCGYGATSGRSSGASLARDPTLALPTSNVCRCAGAVSGMAGVAGGQPLDTVRVRQQQGSGRVLQVCRSMLLREGVTSFYRGMTYPVATAALQVSRDWRKGRGRQVHGHGLQRATVHPACRATDRRA